MPTRAALVVRLRLLHSWQKRLSLPALTTSLLLLVLGVVLLGMTGCGVSDTWPNAPKVVPGGAPGARIKKGNVFTPVPFPLSPNSVGWSSDANSAVAARKNSNTPGNYGKTGSMNTLPAPAPILNSWFYLINGTSLPSDS